MLDWRGGTIDTVLKQLFVSMQANNGNGKNRLATISQGGNRPPVLSDFAERGFSNKPQHDSWSSSFVDFGIE